MIASRDAILLALIQCGARGQLIEEAQGVASDACQAWGHALPKPTSHYPHTATCERCGAAVELKPRPDPHQLAGPTWNGEPVPMSPIRPLPEPGVRVRQRPQGTAIPPGEGVAPLGPPPRRR